MLTDLLAIKVRREQSIRRMLSRLEQQHTALLDEKSRLSSERQHIRQLWEACCATQGVVDRVQLQRLKEELAHHFQKDRMITERLDALEVELNQLQLTRVEQQRRLHKSLLDQEKLQYLLKEIEDGFAQN